MYLWCYEFKLLAYSFDVPEKFSYFHSSVKSNQVFSQIVIFFVYLSIRSN